MPRITVSCRRDDSGVITGRIFDFREHISEVLWCAAAANGEAIAMYGIGVDLGLARHWYQRAGAASSTPALAAFKRLGS